MRYIVDSATVEGVKKIPTRVSKLLLSEGTVGARGFSMGQNVTAVGSRIPEHAHESSEEEEELRAGMAIYMPPGVKHSILNTGDEELKLIWVYSPPLPQHRLQNSNT